jgi:hypothetical protein
LTWLALLVAAVAVAGTLYLSMGMGLKACPLCLYQRAFIFAVFGILAVGLLGGGRPGFLSLLALPPAVGAAALGGFHISLEWKGTLECPAGVFGIGSAPQQAFAAEALLVLLLVLDILKAGVGESFGLGAAMGTLILGALFGVGSILSAPPLPPVPPGGYKLPLEQDGCRPPSRQST